MKWWMWAGLAAVGVWLIDASDILAPAPPKDYLGQMKRLSAAGKLTPLACSDIISAMLAGDSSGTEIQQAKYVCSHLSSGSYYYSFNYLSEAAGPL